MREHKKPLKRSIILNCSIFLLLLGLVLSIVSYVSYRRSLYTSYESRLIDILNYVSVHIDDDDLSNCIDTLEESEKYKELEAFMDDVFENFDIHYLYIVQPQGGDKADYMMDVLTAHTQYEKEHEDDGLYLGYMTNEDYTPEDVKNHYDIMHGDKISFLRSDTVWSTDYIALKPLINSKGEHYALLGADIDIQTIRDTIFRHTAINIFLIVLLGILFIGAFILWTSRKITDPISALERSVVSFAKTSHDQKDPNRLNYDAPAINTKNEVESLSNAISQMSKDMKDYVVNIVEAEAKVTDLKSQITYMDMLAYQDSLTRVKNKAWYDKTKERVDEAILEGSAQFAIVMMDLNYLKVINDTYGHEHGNEYIFGACHQLCLFYQHSPVFRIGGDEFVVLLEKMDYNNRHALLEELVASFKKSQDDSTREPWERYSAAIGMAEYDSRVDTCMDDVFKRADQLMYENKQKMKAARV